MFKKMKLGTQLNISFLVVLFLPMLVATAFSIVYYSNKIQEEAINTISSDLKIAFIMYQNMVAEMSSVANSYAQKKEIPFLLNLNVGQKLGANLAHMARLDELDMITIVDTDCRVLARSHAPEQIEDTIVCQEFVQKAFEGEDSGVTEVMDRAELEKEGLKPGLLKVSPTGKMLMITGAAPVYDRLREKIVGVIIVRRFLNHKAEIFNRLYSKLKVNMAMYEHTNLIAFNAADEHKDKLTLPSADILKAVIEKNEAMHTALIQTGGSITKYMPINDYSGEPIGVLMVQTDVKEYIQTRNTAIKTLVSILLVGFILSFIIKSIIGRRIIVPVQRLKEGTEIIGAGNYKYQLHYQSGDEIGELTEAFNNMAKDLNAYDHQLKEYNMQLEERVRERTAELQITNEQLQHSNMELEETLERLNPGISRLIGNNRQQLGLVFATELVADVCNYTKLNMILGETMMGEFMKRFFRESHKLLAEYRGMFDKTVGDQIVAIFGTPKDNSPASPLHAFDAIECAQKIITAAEKINIIMQAAIQDNYTAVVARHNSLSSVDRETIKIEDLRFLCRIGINTSNPVSDREIDRMRMVMMGAETCIDYTAQGGSVIYAFRLESAGMPGEIHIGENTKRLVDHIYHLEEIPNISLKGLGVQSGYRVIGYKSVFSNIYPRTRFYRTYSNQIPVELLHWLRTIRLGRIQIKEVRKLQDFLEIDIPYLEHLAGVYRLAMFRALFAHAVGVAMELSPERLSAMLFASLWHTATRVVLSDSLGLEKLELYHYRNQLSESADGELAGNILKELAANQYTLPESKIAAICNQFDQQVFDRTYMKQRAKELVSGKEVLSLMKIEGVFEAALIDMIKDLMVAEDMASEKQSDSLMELGNISLPKDPEQLAQAIARNLSPVEQQELVALLSSRLA